MRQPSERAVRIPGRTVRGLLGVLAALVLVVLAGWAPVQASAVTPVASEPRSRQKLSDPPGAVTLAFDRDVDPGVAKVIVVGPDGSNVTDGALIVEGTNVTSQLRDDLARGTYTVHFRIDRSDGDVEGGAFQFAYGSGSFTTPADRSWSGAANEPAVLSGTNPNSSDEPDPPSDAPTTPGVEVTEEGPSTSAEPSDTDPPSTIEPPSGPTSDVVSDVGTPPDSASPSPAGGGRGGATPFVVGGVLLAAAAVGGGFGVWRTRKGRAAPHE